MTDIPETSIARLRLAVTLLTSMVGCATVDFDYPKSESTAVQGTEDTHLGKQLVGAGDAFPAGYSGFLPVSNGIDALSARLLMAERAERTMSL